MALRLLQSHESATHHLMVLSDTFSVPHFDVFLANLQKLLGSLIIRLKSNDITILKYKIFTFDITIIPTNPRGFGVLGFWGFGGNM